MWDECPRIPDVVYKSVSIMDTKQTRDIHDGCKYFGTFVPRDETEWPLTWMLKATRSPSDFWPPLPSNAGEREGVLLPNPSKLKLRHASSTGLCIGLGVVPTGASLIGGFSTTQLLKFALPTKKHQSCIK